MAARASIKAAEEFLARDRVMRALIARHGPCALRKGNGDHFAALLESIVYQQLTGKAAATIHGRVVGALGGTVTPEAVKRIRVQTLLKAGLSNAKAAAVKDLASRTLDGTVPIHDLRELGDDELVARLSQVRGIGRWTAEMFLIFELRRLDVWPVDDYGVRKGYARAYGLSELPKPKALHALGEPFKPYRSIAAWYCWRAVETVTQGRA